MQYSPYYNQATTNLAFCLLAMSSADGKHFDPDRGLTEHRSLSGSKMFDNLKVFLIYFFQKQDIEKIQQTTKVMKNSPISSVLLK